MVQRCILLMLFLSLTITICGQNEEKKSYWKYYSEGCDALKNGDEMKACLYFSEVVKQCPDHSFVYPAWGNALHSLYEKTKNITYLDESIIKYRQGIILNPEDVISYNNLGNALIDYYKINKDTTYLSQSIIQYKSALKINPEDESPLINWAVALEYLYKESLDLKYLRSAIEKYNELTDNETSTHNYKPYLNCGTFLLDASKIAVELDSLLLASACEAFEKAASIEPDEVEIYLYWGEALLESGKKNKDVYLLNKAIDKYEKALELAPTSHAAYCNWGLVLQEIAMIEKSSKKLKESIEKYKMSLAINPEFLESKLNMAVAWCDMYDLTKKKKYLVEAIKETQTILNSEIDNNYLAASLNYNLAQFLLKQAGSKKKDILKMESEISSHYLKANELEKGMGAYDLACLYSLVDNKEQAFYWLEADLNTNYWEKGRDAYETDSDLGLIKGDDRFRNLLNSAFD